MKFGNDHIFDMANFDETSRWMGGSKNEFSHSLALQATAAAPASCGRFTFLGVIFPFYVQFRRLCLSLIR
jgi:hypothetical protein